MSSLSTASINSMSDAKKMSLAYEIADVLNDRKCIKQHIEFVHKYSEEYLREQLEYVLRKADHEIDTSRAAYYVYMVKKNGWRFRN